MKVLQFLGIIDDGFKKDAEKWGTEEAMKAASDVTYRQALIQRDRKAAAEAWLAPRMELKKEEIKGRKELKQTSPRGSAGKPREFKISDWDEKNKRDVFQKDNTWFYVDDKSPVPVGTVVAKKPTRKGSETEKLIDALSQDGTSPKQRGNTFDDAVARLRANPQEAALFDQQFGKGMAAKYLKR
jgi:hypothetical protein